jgi:hypothetical protein
MRGFDMPFLNIPLNGVLRACLAATLFVAVTQREGYTAQAGQVSVIPPTSVVVPPIPVPTPPAPVAPALTPTAPVFAPSGQPSTQTVGLPPSTVQNVLSANISVLSPDQTREALGLIATILDNPAGLSRNQRQILRRQRSALERQLSD